MASSGRKNMRVRSFRNTVLFFYFAAAKILQSRGKAKGDLSWWGDWADGRRLSLCPTKRLFTSADDGE
jgi:hypothetical protein